MLVRDFAVYPRFFFFTRFCLRLKTREICKEKLTYLVSFTQNSPTFSDIFVKTEMFLLPFRLVRKEKKRKIGSFFAAHRIQNGWVPVKHFFSGLFTKNVVFGAPRKRCYRCISVPIKMFFENHVRPSWKFSSTVTTRFEISRSAFSVRAPLKLVSHDVLCFPVTPTVREKKKSEKLRKLPINCKSLFCSRVTLVVGCFRFNK